MFDIFKTLENKSINWKKDRYNFMDCHINGVTFTIDNQNEESIIKSLLDAIKDLSQENEKLKEENTVLKEQNEVFSLIKENFEIDSIDISIIIEK